VAHAFGRRASIGLASTAGILGALLIPVGSAAAATPTCFGQPVTMMGTEGPDELIGRSDVRDVIYGAGGDDYVSGGDFYGAGAAPDLLCGGPGNDHLEGSPGNDKLNGGDGNDEVDGGNGADVEQGNAGDDTVGQGSFADADAADDISRGGIGNDTLYGGWGRDKLYGEAGNDTIYDSECDGPTVLDGGPGNDYLESWSSSFDGWHGNVCSSVADSVAGGTGTDTAQVDQLDSVSAVERLTLITRPTA
jgi:Ca2+-binding RTX toxin-like protein